MSLAVLIFSEGFATDHDLPKFGHSWRLKGPKLKMNNLKSHVVIYTETFAESYHGRWKSLILVLS